jgi:hypothetical protein
MKLLFQGGWKATRGDKPSDLELINNYCKSFAKFFVESGHQLILDTTREFGMSIVKEIAILLNDDSDIIKKRIVF